MSLLPWEITRELIVKTDEDTSPSYGCSPDKRLIRDHLKYGIVNLDKPSGPSSHEVSAFVKKILGVSHAGHGGTLDPKVTGVLPVALEEATKVIGAFLYSGKEYVCVMRLHSDVAESRVREVMSEFVGDIFQKPPLRSSVQRSTRVRRIYYISDFEFGGRLVLFKVGCEAGTYIRKLVYDVGEVLGHGAHMEELRRIRAGSFTVDKELVSLYDLKEGYDRWVDDGDESMLRKVVMPMERAVMLLPKVYIRDSAVSSICHGAKLAVPGIAKLETGIEAKDIVSIFSLKDELIALGRATMGSTEIVKNDRGFAVNVERVIMDIDVYPKMWKSHG